MAVMRALLPSSTAHLLNLNHRLSTRILHFRSLPLASSAPQTVEAQPKHPITNVVDILRERGLVHSITSKNLRSVCSNPNSIPLKVYCVFDSTAESLHLGNLVGLIVLSWFRRCGHKIVAIIGDAKDRFGDPSGKSVERPELGVETIKKNSAEIRALVYRILRRACVEIDLKMGCIKDEILNSDSKESCNCFTVSDYYDWSEEMTAIDFLSEVGKYFRVKKLLPSEERMNFAEFSYQFPQGYDYVYMFKNMGVNVQIGGSDQWGNITVGTELVRKILKVKGAYGLTFPLLLKSDGSKFGKSEDGAIWLSPAMLSPYKFYQYIFFCAGCGCCEISEDVNFLELGGD